MMSDLIPTSDLEFANQLLDTYVDLLRQVQRSGVECSAEQLCLAQLADVDVHRESRCALLLSVALLRLAAQ